LLINLYFDPEPHSKTLHELGGGENMPRLLAAAFATAMFDFSGKFG
jgi:hypothetical protein